MKTLNLALALTFLLFAALQYNDPDPLIWMVIYAAVALLFGMAAFGRRVVRPARVLAIVLLAWAATMLPGMLDWVRMGMPSITSSMKAEEPHIELVREFLGLLIAGGACTFLAWKRVPGAPKA